MASILTKAAKGNRAAVTHLYEQTKKTAYFVAQQLLRDDDKVALVLEKAYRDTLALSALDNMADTTAFENAVLDAVVHHAKVQLTRQNPKALRIPADRRFDIRTAPTVGETDEATVFAAFSDLQRLIFVLHNATDMSEDRLAQAAKLDRRTLTEALHAERANVEICLPNGSYDAFVDTFKTQKSAVKVTRETDAAIEAVIGEIVAPAEKARKKRTFKAVLIAIGACVLLAGFSALLIWDMTTPDKPSSSNSDTTKTTNAAHKTVGTVTSVKATHYADIDIKDYGTVTVALDNTTAPETVFNFVALAESGFYNGLTFHRIMDGFMMQGGDPKGNGTGGSDKTVTGEFADNGIENPLSHVRGAISMARSGDPNSGSSQFFIVHEDSTFLDGQYAAFGYVTEGMDIVDKICTEAEPTDNNGTIPSAKQPIINTITLPSAV